MIAGLLLGLAALWQAWHPLGVRQALGWTVWCLPMSLLAALPPVLLLPVVESPLGRRLPWLRQLRDQVISLMVPLLGRVRWVEMLALAFLAGLLEEGFFRGVLQREMGLIPASLVFGLMHAVSVPYMMWASLMGGYLGWLFHITHKPLGIDPDAYRDRCRGSALHSLD
ncbi:hypothetical protein NKDENANG_02979 [Candidatus Entotheonellaceae bacterium PAL068K]